MNERKYFYVRAGSQTPAGPHTLYELARLKDMGELQEDTLVASSGESEWVKLGDVLTAHSTALPPLPPVPSSMALPPVPGSIPTVEVPETAGPCPMCGQEIPLDGKPVIPEHCPHCGLLLRAQNPDNFWQQFKVALKKIFIMRGRATRMEYWGFYIFIYIFSICISIPLSVIQVILMTESQALNYGEHFLEANFWSSPAGTLQLIQFAFSFLLYIPTISVGVRRLHDIGRSGWWMWAMYLLPVLTIIPIIGLINKSINIPTGLITTLILAFISFAVSIVVLIFMLTDSQKGRNKYGASPKYPWL